jgi:hypothetical protein
VHCLLADGAHQRSNWVTLLPLAQWAVNASPGAASFSGNEALFGRKLHHLTGIFGAVDVCRPAGCASAWFEDRLAQLQQFQSQLAKVDKAQKRQAERHRRPGVSFAVGDWVWRESSTDGSEGIADKLRPKWVGPGRILKQNSPNCYEVVFGSDPPLLLNVEQLKPYFLEGGSRGPALQVGPPLPSLSPEFHLTVTPAEPEAAAQPDSQPRSSLAKVVQFLGVPFLSEPDQA